MSGRGGGGGGWWRAVLDGVVGEKKHQETEQDVRSIVHSAIKVVELQEQVKAVRAGVGGSSAQVYA